MELDDDGFDVNAAQLAAELAAQLVVQVAGKLAGFLVCNPVAYASIVW